MNPPTLIQSLVDYKEWLIETLPNQGRWTAKEYLWLTDETNRMVELNDGTLEVLPMPTDQHQLIKDFLMTALNAYLRPRGGRALDGPLRLRISSRIIREPDIMLLIDAKDPRRTNRFWKGADLTLEIVSKKGRKRDYQVKRKDYASAGIPEYWIVDPKQATITVLHLQGNAYAEQVYQRGDTVASVTLAGFSVAVNDVLDAD